MNKQITIAVDAMGGDDSPKKIIKGIELFLKNNADVSFKIFGNEYKCLQILDHFIPNSPKNHDFHQDITIFTKNPPFHQ